MDGAQRNDRDQENGQNNDGNPNGGQRQRPSFHPVSICPRSTIILDTHREVSLNVLEMGDDLYMNPPTGVDLNSMLMYCQLIRIITPTRDNDVLKYQRRHRAQNTAANANYTRILMCRVVAETNTQHDGKVFYVLQNSKENKTILDRNPALRDNGSLTIGSCMAIVNPDPIDKFLQNIPMISSSERVVILRQRRLEAIPYPTELDGNEIKAFLIHGSRLTVTRVHFEEAICSGLFCDRQRLYEAKGRSGCGCFSQNANRTNIVGVYYMLFEIGGGQRMGVPDFSSYQFMKYFTKGLLSIDVRATQLQSGYTAYTLLLTAIRAVIVLVNNNGGWSFHGWGKRGLINDMTLLGQELQDGDDGKTAANEITTHIIHAHPTNSDFMDPTKDLYVQLEDLKFDLSSL